MDVWENHAQLVEDGELRGCLIHNALTTPKDSYFIEGCLRLYSDRARPWQIWYGLLRSLTRIGPCAGSGRVREYPSPGLRDRTLCKRRGHAGYSVVDDCSLLWPVSAGATGSVAQGSRTHRTVGTTPELGWPRCCSPTPGTAGTAVRISALRCTSWASRHLGLAARSSSVEGW